MNLMHIIINLTNMMSQYPPMAASPSQNPSDKVLLSLSCRNLADLDTFSKSDPVVYVYIKDSKQKQYALLG